MVYNFEIKEMVVKKFNGTELMGHPVYNIYIRVAQKTSNVLDLLFLIVF